MGTVPILAVSFATHADKHVHASTLAFMHLYGSDTCSKLAHVC